MTWLAWSPLLANAALAAAGPWLARVLPPRAAVRLLAAAMVTVAAGTGFVLAALGFFVLAPFPPVEFLGDWSPAALRASQPVPAAAEIVAVIVVLVLMVAALRRAAQGGRDLIRAALACRRLGPASERVVLIKDDEPDAYAVPGIAGRIVVSTAMMDALPPDERHVLLAHEAAHLGRHHHLYIQLAELAAAANPLLRRTARAVRVAVERDADEAAALAVGDRRLVARALARAGLAKAAARRTRQGQGAVAVLAGADSLIKQRTTALLAPPPQPRRLLAAGLLILTLLTVLATGVTADQTDDRLDHAGARATTTVVR